MKLKFHYSTLIVIAVFILATFLLWWFTGR
jgi:hypothetical protein